MYMHGVLSVCERVCTCMCVWRVVCVRVCVPICVHLDRMLSVRVRRSLDGVCVYNMANRMIK